MFGVAASVVVSEIVDMAVRLDAFLYKGYVFSPMNPR